MGIRLGKERELILSFPNKHIFALGQVCIEQNLYQSGESGLQEQCRPRICTCTCTSTRILPEQGAGFPYLEGAVKWEDREGCPAQPRIRFRFACLCIQATGCLHIHHAILASQMTRVSQAQLNIAICVIVMNLKFHYEISSKAKSFRIYFILLLMDIYFHQVGFFDFIVTCCVTKCST